MPALFFCGARSQSRDLALLHVEARDASTAPATFAGSPLFSRGGPLLSQAYNDFVIVRGVHADERSVQILDKKRKIIARGSGRYAGADTVVLRAKQLFVALAA